MSSRPGKEAEELQRLAANFDMYDRIARTIQQGDIDEKVARAVTFQLVGAPPLQQDLGEDIRGDIHIGVVTDAETTFPQFLTVVKDVTPQETALLNGTSTSQAGLIGGVKGGELTPGPVLDGSTELTIIDQFSELDNQAQSAFQQILDTGQYSFSKSRFQDTVPASGSILVATNPRYGNFDEYEPIGDQLDLTPAVAGSLDLVVTNIRGQTEKVDTLEDPLEGDLARQYIALARTRTPEISEESLGVISNYLEELESSIDMENGYTPSTVRLRRTLIRFTLAHARLNLTDKTSSADANRVISLVEAALADVGIDPEVGEFDADLV